MAVDEAPACDPSPRQSHQPNPGCGPPLVISSGKKTILDLYVNLTFRYKVITKCYSFPRE